MNRIEIIPQPLKIDGNEIYRACHIERYLDDVFVKREELWFCIPGIVNPPDDCDCSSYLLAVLMDAMLERADIHIKGRVSKSLLGNLSEFQLAWNRWAPEKYSAVKIQADEVEGVDISRNAQAVSVFTGGVDSTFTVWRHIFGHAGYGSQDLKYCAFVHGYDIPLDDLSGFQRACDRSRNTLMDVGLALVPIRTNCRQLSNVNWEHLLGCAIVSALSNLKNHAGTCLIASGETYEALVIPWGSSPITDHLLSSHDFRVVHDGAGFSRTEKLIQISNWEAGSKNIRVCWQSNLKDINCGKCEKCIRTKFNYILAGVKSPECFTGPINFSDVRKIVLGSQAAREEWMLILKMANDMNIKDQWVHEVKKTIDRRPSWIVNLFLPVGSRRREVIKQIRNYLVS